MKLITYNIWHGTHLEKAIQFLKAEEPDVVCLQEVATKGRGFQPGEMNIYEEIRKGLGFEGKYSAMVAFDEGEGVYDAGVALLSKWPVEDWREHFYWKEYQVYDEYWKYAYEWPRAVLGGVVKSPEGGLPVFTTHFPVTPKASVTDYQLEAGKRLKNYLKAFDSYVLCGDMNTPVGTETYELLKEGLVDLSPPKEPTLHPTIHRVGELGYHVDYVFLKGDEWKGQSAWVPLVDGSDHLPVVVELEKA